MISSRGNAAYGWLLLMLATASAVVVTTLAQIKKQVRLTTKDSFEATVLVTSHSLAASFKQVLLANYNDYLGNTKNGWPACAHGAPSPTDYFQLIDAPPPSCLNVSFYLNGQTPGTSFQTDETPARDRVTLAAMKTTSFIPVVGINKSLATLTLTEMNPGRMQVIVTAAIDYGNDRNLASRKLVREVIDLPRTLNAPRNETGCHLCRAVPGSVCCTNEVNITYLDAAGSVVQARFEKDTQKLTLSTITVPDPKSVSAKNIASGITRYIQQSFVERTVVDAALGKGMTYLLTTDGRITIGMAPPALVTDPKWTSIAWIDDTWYLLRADGAVYTANELLGSPTFQEVFGLRLPMAQALTMGAGPAAIP